MKSLIKPLAKSALIPLGLTTAASTADAGIPKKSQDQATLRIILIISKDELKDIKLVKSLEDSGILLKGVSETIQNEDKEQKGVFLSMLLGTYGASLLGNTLADKGIKRA